MDPQQRMASVTLETVPNLVRRTWRDLSWESQRVPEQGMDHAVIVLEGVRSRENELNDLIPETMVVRVPYTPEYRAQAMLESSLIAQLFRGTKVRVPETVRQAYARGTFNTPEPVILTMQTWVEGEPLDAERWAGLSATQRANVAEQLGGLMASMHSMNPDVLPISRVESWWADGAATGELRCTHRSLPGKQERMRALLSGTAAGSLATGSSAAGSLTADERERISKAMADVEALLARPGQQRALTHGDLYSAHMPWTASGGVGVIDFSDMTVGDPAVDYMHFAEIDPEMPRLVHTQALVHHESNAGAAAAPLYWAPSDSGPVEDTHILDRARVYKEWDRAFLLLHGLGG